MTRRANITIIDAVSDSKLFAPWFRNRSSWAAWFAFLAALFALPMTTEELAIYREGMNLPDDLIKRRAARDEALDRVAATKVARKSLMLDLGHAQNDLLRAKQQISESATAILVEEGVVIAGALRAAWKSVWELYDELNALSGCWLPHAEGLRPTRLPADVVSTLQFIAALDHRQHPGGTNVAFKRSDLRWRSWHAALSKDFDAAKPEVSDKGNSSIAVERVA